MRPRAIFYASYVLLLSVFPSSSPAAAQETSRFTEQALAAIDAKQKDLVARADVRGLQDLSAKELTINAPTNRVLTHDQFLAMMRSGQIGAEAFERTIERVTVVGNIGVVMGSEIFTPTAGSELGRTYGVVPLKRRYTNIYQLDHGQWKWLARHANVVPGASSQSASGAVVRRFE